VFANELAANNNQTAVGSTQALGFPPCPPFCSSLDAIQLVCTAAVAADNSNQPPATSNMQQQQQQLWKPQATPCC